MAFLVLALGVVFVIVSIGVLKVHPFLALIMAAILVGILSPIPLTAQNELKSDVELARGDLRHQLEQGVLSEKDFLRRWKEIPWEVQDQWLERQKRTGGQSVLALEITAQEFGSTAGAIGIVIVLAAIIGQCLMDSGAADKIVRKLLSILGEKRSAEALLGSGYFLSIPVFFDTVFFLLVPLARALRLRTGRNYTLYVMAICAGAVVTHSLVPPTPGPLVMVENLVGLDLGMAIGVGFLLGLVPAFMGGLLFSRYANRRLDIPLREVAGSSHQDLEEIVRRSEEQLPGFVISTLPVVLPVAFITGNTLLQYLSQSGSLDLPSSVLALTAFLGNKNCALLAAAFLAIWILMRQKGLNLAQLGHRLEAAILSAGVIILITSAGGAFGKMLARTGISEVLGEIAGGDLFHNQGVFFVLLAWGLAATMKIAQGSGTVAMITASSIMAAVLEGTNLPFHVIYIFAAVGFGSLVVSWMNDSGFWVVCKMSGFTERETLSTWTLLLVFIGVLGLIEVLILSILLPLA
ncbi:GntP family permease [Acidobacteria bacterium AH-259-O06]|nr:GntP family permease [Acidobacteria bacterium AH-259-O06]